MIVATNASVSMINSRVMCGVVQLSVLWFEL